MSNTSLKPGHWWIRKLLDWQIPLAGSRLFIKRVYKWCVQYMLEQEKKKSFIVNIHELKATQMCTHLHRCWCGSSTSVSNQFINCIFEVLTLVYLFIYLFILNNCRYDGPIKCNEVLGRRPWHNRMRMWSPVWGQSSEYWCSSMPHCSKSKYTTFVKCVPYTQP